MQMAIYHNKAAEGTMSLAQFGNASVGRDEQTRTQFQISMGQNQQAQAKQIQVQHSEKHETTINGEPANFLSSPRGPHGFR